MSLRLNRNSQNIQRIVDKMNLYVRLYAKKHKVYKYIRMIKRWDSLGTTYDVLILDCEKIFTHTSFFKSNKHIMNMIDTKGEKTFNFNMQMNLWFLHKHPDYLEAEKIQIKLFDKDELFIPDDLQTFNKLYRKLKNGN